MSQYNILVVDDDREIVRSLGKLLELEGYRVKKAYNGMEALDILMTEQIHLILLDVMMGEISGYRLARILREQPETAHIPIIFCTARDSEDDIVTGLNIGADDYIAKPFSTREVIARVKAVLRRTVTTETERVPERLTYHFIPDITTQPSQKMLYHRRKRNRAYQKRI